LVADVSVFVVPCICRAERGDNVDLDTLMSIRRQMANLFLRVKVADSHISEHAVTPLRTSLYGHHARELIQAHLLAVIPPNQVFSPQEEFSRFVVLYRDLLVRCKVVPEHFAEMPGRVLVVITGDVQDANRGNLHARFDSISDADESLSEYFCVAVVGAVDQGSLGRLLVCSVEVQEIIAYRQNDFFDLVRLYAVDHSIDRMLIVTRCYLQVVIIGLSLLVPAEFSEVAVVQAELDQMLGDSLASRFVWLTLGHPLRQSEDRFLYALRSPPLHLDRYLAARGLPQRLNAVSPCRYFSLTCDFPVVYLDLGYFPNLQVKLGVCKEFFDCVDFIAMVDEACRVLIEDHRQITFRCCFDFACRRLLCFGVLFESA